MHKYFRAIPTYGVYRLYDRRSYIYSRAINTVTIRQKILDACKQDRTTALHGMRRLLIGVSMSAPHISNTTVSECYTVYIAGIWRGIKFGCLAVHVYNRQIYKIRQYFLYSCIYT